MQRVLATFTWNSCQIMQNSSYSTSKPLFIQKCIICNIKRSLLKVTGFISVCIILIMKPLVFFKDEKIEET